MAIIIKKIDTKFWQKETMWLKQTNVQCQVQYTMWKLKKKNI